MIHKLLRFLDYLDAMASSGRLAPFTWQDERTGQMTTYNTYNQEMLVCIGQLRALVHTLYRPPVGGHE